MLNLNSIIASSVISTGLLFVSVLFNGRKIAKLESELFILKEKGNKTSNLLNLIYKYNVPKTEEGEEE